MVAFVHVFSGGGGGGGASAAADATPYRGQVLSVPTNAVTTVVSRVVPPGFLMKLDGVIATGSTEAEWYVEDDGVEVYRTRTSASDRAVEILHGHSLSFDAGHTVRVRVAHQEPSSQNFYATMLGHDA